MMELNKCRLCHSQLIVKGIQQVCIGCGNTTRSTLIFSTEQEFQNTNIRRTTQHIKMKQDRLEKQSETLFQHLQLNWVQYLQAYKKWMQNMADALKVDISVVWRSYLDKNKNKPLRSNWTIPRQSNQSKYLESSDLVVKVEDENEEHTQEKKINFEEELRKLQRVSIEESVIELNSKKIKKQKNKHFMKKKVKKLIQTPQRTGRRQSTSNAQNRRGSINGFLDRNEFIENMIKNLSLNDSLYHTLVDIYYDTYYCQAKAKDITQSINQIKHVQKNPYQKIELPSLTLEQLQHLTPSMQIQMYLLNDYFQFQYKMCANISNMIQQIQEKGTNKNVKFLNRKIKLINSQLSKNIIKVQKNPFPIDFGLSIIIIYASALINDIPLSPRSLVYKIKSKQIDFLDGFNSYLHQQLNQYLTLPSHIPSLKYIQLQTLKFLKYLNLPLPRFTESTFIQITKELALYLNINQEFYNIIMSLYYKNYEKRKTKVPIVHYEQFACAIIIEAFEFYLNYNIDNAREQLIQMLQPNNSSIIAYDYQDLEYAEISHLPKDNYNFSSYYHNDNKNQRLQTKLANLYQIYDEYIINECCIQQSETIEKITPKYGDSCNSILVKYLHQHLAGVLEDTENGIKQYI